jgi:rSAM/selenodomain-associated transferase 1
MKQAVLIFAKNLIHGEVKTRLAETIGNDRAFSVYKELLQHTKDITKNIDADKTIFYSNNIDEKDIWKHETYKKQMQKGNDLGERMLNAFEHAFKNGYEEVVIIGTDCFELTSSIINDAFTFLKKHDIVIGPAKDGGYYLLGMKKLYPELFQNIYWSTENVLIQTIAVCSKGSLTYHLLQQLSDVDEEKDLIKTKFALTNK